MIEREIACVDSDPLSRWWVAVPGTLRARATREVLAGLPDDLLPPTHPRGQHRMHEMHEVDERRVPSQQERARKAKARKAAKRARRSGR